MATFSDNKFNHANYALYRPGPPDSLFETLFNYHNGIRDLCIDLGTGHGVVAHRLGWKFNRVIGIDKSDGMIHEATAHTPPDISDKVQFRVGEAESMPFLDSQTVDLVIACQSAHWFDTTALWQELSRIVRSGGTVAFWNFGRYFLIDHRHAQEVLRQYSANPEYLGSYWPQPGNAVWRDRMRPIECKDLEGWMDLTRLEYEPAEPQPPTSPDYGIKVEFSMTLSNLESVLRTWSAVFQWRIANPHARSREEGGSGDIIDTLLEEMILAEKDWKSHASGDSWRDIEIRVEMRSILLLARKR